MIQEIPTMCLNCSTVCGMVAKVDKGKIIKLEGNPNDPNSQGKLCAKGQAAINMVEDPDRILYPMKRKGPRGSGEWERITWDQAIKEIAERCRPLRMEKRNEELLLQYGRDRTNGFLDRFTDAFGTPNKLGHRGLCSLNKRMAIRSAIGDTDWDTADFADSKVILNFGSNLYEAHQGHVGMVKRVAEAKRKGARLVTFDVRLSNTAAQSDQWVPIFPGTDGLVALAVGHVILREDLQNTAFIKNWTNASLAEWQAHYQQYTPEYASRLSGVPIKTIEQVARDFAAAAPMATTVSNRGAHAHENGFHNEWAIISLNALVGSIGEEGGWGYIPGDVNRLAKQPGPMPPKPTVRTELSHPSEFPFANALYPRAVSSFIYSYLLEGRAKIDTLISYYVNAPMSWPEGPTKVRDIMLDQDIIPFHVAIDAFYSETVEVADIVLPDATFLEKWDLDSRNSYDFRPYVGLRQPVVAPPGECRDIRDILIQLAHAIDPEMASFFPFENGEDFVRQWASSVPGGLNQLQETGFWVDEAKPKRFRPYLQDGGCETDDPNLHIAENNVAYLKTNKEGKEESLEPIGILKDGKVLTGFQTEDRLFQFKQKEIDKLFNGSKPMHPSYIPIKAHEQMRENDFILTTFKWNVHTQSRTANQEWLTEIVGDNPCWINPKTAMRMGIQNGDEMILTRRNRGKSENDEDENSETLSVKAYVTEGIHPKVLAISASFGHWQYGRTAKGKGVNPNPMIKGSVDPVGGGQAWNDTIVEIRPL